MTDTITLTGVVATIPRNIVTGDKLAITSFRLASTQRRFDRGRNRWVDADTNWYTITTFRQLALNVQNSVVKGDRVVVTGRLRIRDWDTGERSGTTVDIEAEAVGHDLSWGTTAFTRVTNSATAAGAPPAGDGDSGVVDAWPSRASAPRRRRRMPTSRRRTTATDWMPAVSALTALTALTRR